MNYFAYGSNMSLLRMQKRVPSAKALGVYILAGHLLKFHKAGMDGSGKGDAYFTGLKTDSVFGVLYSMQYRDKSLLDDAEGLGYGYAEKKVQLKTRTGEKATGFLYYATTIDNTLHPFSWYIEHIVVGARAAALPEPYVDKICGVETIEDEDRNRDHRERSLYFEQIS
ncbi:gamma-glutamylcyclotransferase [Desulforhopalus sp. IMCC35007]|nr:gamma-glutamylcyclotransferase [Desulforhopalus sp. IMCC35007]